MAAASHSSGVGAGLMPPGAATADGAPTKAVVRKHHWLVRVAHWSMIPLLLGLGLSGMSIYWAAPVFEHAPNPDTGVTDYLQDIGSWVCRHVPGLHLYGDPPNWFYNHFSLGTGLLADALRLHWLLGYPFAALGILYWVGAIRSGSYRSLLPRRTDIVEIPRMMRYYVGLPFARVLRREWKHPEIHSKYNALQRSAYFSVVIAATLISLNGWAIHKPEQLWWLTALFGGYQWARIWHFVLAWYFVLFVIPHVILAVADGWDTVRSMVTGWSQRLPERESDHGN